jgi:WhiB family transcriptional regulator, redox-sensing transcriptional regulator
MDSVESTEMSLLDGLLYELKNNDFGWQNKAECQGEATDLFFMDMEDSQINHIKMREARAICDRCQVKKECLDFALVNNIDYGVWGGTSPYQRKEMRHEQRHRV